jgi:ubiquinone/menaquinone biosynthesis C-methylase UbiE
MAMQKPLTHNGSDRQELEIYWDAQFAETLETWGEGNAWSEIQSLIVNCRGRVLDIACGTGKVLEILESYRMSELYGCDISPYLIGKAAHRGIRKNRVVVCDATRLPYKDNSYDYSYSIGSLEHFTERGIETAVSECYRVTKFNSFHMVPVTKSGKDEGWVNMTQSFFYNSADWWLHKFKLSYSTIHILDSQWNDDVSTGKWFVCIK